MRNGNLQERIKGHPILFFESITMSERIKEITAELGDLKRKRDDLEAELRTLQEKKVKDVMAGLAHIPRNLEETAEAWQAGKVTVEDVQHLWDLLWGDESNCFKWRGKNASHVVCDLVNESDVLDGMAAVYFDLGHKAPTGFNGPFRYGYPDEEEEAEKVAGRPGVICVYAK